jgi:putative ABC transport system ATP-binding protein
MAGPGVPLRVEGASKSFRKGSEVVTALREVYLDVGSGEFVVLAGRSGAGKTTLLNLVAALDRPDAGTISVGDKMIQSLPPTAAAGYRRDTVGVVFQQLHLLPQLTAEENPVCRVA